MIFAPHESASKQLSNGAKIITICVVELKIWTIFVQIPSNGNVNMAKNGLYLEFLRNGLWWFLHRLKAVSKRFQAVQKSSKSVGSNSKYVPIKVWIVFVFSKSGALWFVFFWFGSVRSVVRSITTSNACCPGLLHRLWLRMNALMMRIRESLLNVLNIFSVPIDDTIVQNLRNE